MIFNCKDKLMKNFIVTVLLCCTFALAYGAVYFTGDSEKNPITYRCGEEIVFKISLVEDGEPLAGVPVSWNLFGEDGKRGKGTAVSDPDEPLTIRTSLDKPGFVYVEVTAMDKDGKPLSGALPLSISAGADVDKICQTVPEPEDFDKFWAKQKKRLAAVPMEVKLTPEKSRFPNVDCWQFEIKSVGKYPATGYISMPGNAKPGSLKAKVFFYGYGFGSNPMRDEFAADGALVLSVSQQGLPQGKDHQFYVDQSRGAYRGFCFRNNGDARNNDFIMMILRDLRAVQYLKTRPEWNKKDIYINGESMGALQSIHVAALEPAVNELDITIPWCANLGGVTAGRFAGWRPPYTPALNYFDIVNQAKRIKCPVKIGIGLGDRICPASGQFAMFNAMKCDRTLTAAQTGGHRKASPGAEKYSIEAKAQKRGLSTPGKDYKMQKRACRPTPRLEQDSYDWYERHQFCKSRSKQRRADLIFIGDSITHFWETLHGGPVWNKYFRGQNVFNLGYGYDRTPNVLWRLQNGEFEGQSPAVAVLNIGTNNFKTTQAYPGDTPEDTADGIEEIVKTLRSMSPQSRIIVMAVFPRMADSHRENVIKLNGLLKKRLTGRKNVIFLDLTKDFMTPDGRRNEKFFRDDAHLTNAGYEVWIKGLMPFISKYVNTDTARED